MLVLSRKVNERIIIGHGLCIITLAEIEGEKARIGLDAPKWLPIYRAEVEEARDKTDSDYYFRKIVDNCIGSLPVPDYIKAEYSGRHGGTK